MFPTKRSLILFSDRIGAVSAVSGRDCAGAAATGGPERPGGSAFDPRWRYAAGVGGYDGDGRVTVRTARCWSKYGLGSPHRPIPAGYSRWCWTRRRRRRWFRRGGHWPPRRCMTRSPRWTPSRCPIGNMPFVRGNWHGRACAWRAAAIVYASNNKRQVGWDDTVHERRRSTRGPLLRAAGGARWPLGQRSLTPRRCP